MHLGDSDPPPPGILPAQQPPEQVWGSLGGQGKPGGLGAALAETQGGESQTGGSAGLKSLRPECTQGRDQPARLTAQPSRRRAAPTQKRGNWESILFQAVQK